MPPFLRVRIPSRLSPHKKRAPNGTLLQIRTGGELGMSGHATHALRLQSLAAFRPRATNAFAFA